jgi:type IV pilus assembly protein PilW
MNQLKNKFVRVQAGVTLIELMVAVVIGLVVVLAATNVLVIGEAHKRTTTGNNDSSQSGSFAAYSLDRAIRSAGSGFGQAWNQGVFGCNLSASRVIGSATTILPRAGAFPAPFQGFLGGASNTLRVAPVLIGQGQSAGNSDVLMVMSGNGSTGDITRPIRSGVAGTNNLRLDNTIGIANGDIGIVTLPGGTDCLIEQIDTATPADLSTLGNEVLPIGGAYLNTDGGTLGTLAASGAAYFSSLGNVNASNVQFQLFGVDTNRVLVAYDLLRSGATPAEADPLQPLADGVAELHAIYGLDTTIPHDNIVDSWVAPTGAWSAASVLADPNKMRQIVAVRIAIVMRSSNYEKQEVTLQRPILFSGTPGEIAPDVYVAGSDNRHFRLRVIDTTIPMRNMLLLPAS